MYKLKKILNKCYQIAQLIVLFANYLFVSIQQCMKKLPDNEKTILFTLEDDRLYRDKDGNGRYAYLMLNLFSMAGYNVYLYSKVDFKRFVYFREFGRYMYSIKNLKIINKIPKRTDNIIYVFDSAVKEVVKHSWKRLVYFNHLKPVSCCLGDLINIPYFMHPLMYKTEEQGCVKSYRNNKRKIRIFMGGNISRTWYDSPRLQKYDQLTRLEGIREVFQLGESVRLKWNVDEFRQFLKQSEYVNQCVLIKTDHSLSIPSKEWINIVGSSDFFLCLSGTDLPMCHNAIESLSVGTIPIIAYQDWFYPALEHKKNAIVYSGKKDLMEKVKEVLSMSGEEILRMRKNAIEYYDKYLSGNDFTRRFEFHDEKISTIMLHPRWINDEVEEIEGQKVFTEIKRLLEKLSKLDKDPIVQENLRS